jgi:hypothetical protein
MVRLRGSATGWRWRMRAPMWRGVFCEAFQAFQIQYAAHAEARVAPWLRAPLGCCLLLLWA